MRLEDCTKDELLYILNRIQGLVEYDIRWALADVERLRNRKLIQKMEEYAENAHEAREQYIALVREYAGKPASDIPYGTLNKATIFLQKAQEWEERYKKIGDKLDKASRGAAKGGGV